MYKILKSSITLLITALLFSCFSNENGGSTKFSVNGGKDNIEMLMNSTYSLAVAINPSTPGYNDNNFKKTITASIISKNEDEETGEPIIYLSRETIHLSTYLPTSSLSISTRQASGAVKIKFSVSGESSSSQIVTVNVSSMDISINGDSASIDSPLYVYSKNTNGNSTGIEMPVLVKIFKKDAASVGPFNIAVETYSGSSSPVIIAHNGKTSDDFDVSERNADGYYQKAFELSYDDATIMPDLTVKISIVDKSKKGEPLSFTKRIIAIPLPSDPLFRTAVINNNHKIFLTEHEGQVNIPIQLLMMSYSDYEENPDKKYKVTVYSPENSGVNLINKGDIVSELDISAHDRETNYFTLDAVNTSSIPTQLRITVAPEDNSTELKTFYAPIVVLPQKGGNHIIINNRYSDSDPLLLSQGSGVISVYVADNNLLDSNDLSGYSISSSSDTALKFDNTKISLKPHTIKYIQYNITPLYPTQGAVSKDQDNKIQISKNKTVVYSQPTVYVVNPLILRSYTQGGNRDVESQDLGNTIDAVKGRTGGFYSDSLYFKFAVISSPLKNSQSDTFAKALFRLAGKKLNMTQQCFHCNSSSIGISEPPSTAPVWINFPAFPINGQNPSYDMYLDMTIFGQTVRQKLTINLFSADTDFQIIAPKSNNLVPAADPANASALFLINTVSAEFTISLTNTRPTNNLVVPIKFSGGFINGNLQITPKDCYFFTPSPLKFILTPAHRSCTFTVKNSPPSTDFAQASSLILDSPSNVTNLFTADIYNCTESLSAASDTGVVNITKVGGNIPSEYENFGKSLSFRMFQQSPYMFDYKSSGCADLARSKGIDYKVKIGVQHNVENPTPSSYIWTQFGEDGFNKPNTRPARAPNFYCPDQDQCVPYLLGNFKYCDKDSYFTCKANNGKSFRFSESAIIDYGTSSYPACERGKICYAYYPKNPANPDKVTTTASLIITLNNDSTISPTQSEDINKEFFPEIKPIDFPAN